MSSDFRYLFISYLIQALGFRGFHVMAVLVRFFMEVWIVYDG